MLTVGSWEGQRTPYRVDGPCRKVEPSKGHQTAGLLESASSTLAVPAPWTRPTASLVEAVAYPWDGTVTPDAALWINANPCFDNSP